MMTDWHRVRYYDICLPCRVPQCTALGLTYHDLQLMLDHKNYKELGARGSLMAFSPLSCGGVLD